MCDLRSDLRFSDSDRVFLNFRNIVEKKSLFNSFFFVGSVDLYKNV